MSHLRREKKKEDGRREGGGGMGKVVIQNLQAEWQTQPKTTLKSLWFLIVVVEVIKILGLGIKEGYG